MLGGFGIGGGRNLFNPYPSGLFLSQIAGGQNLLSCRARVLKPGTGIGQCIRSNFGKLGVSHFYYDVIKTCYGRRSKIDIPLNPELSLNFVASNYFLLPCKESVNSDKI